MNTNDPIQRARTVREEMATLDKQIVTKEADEARLHGVIADYQRRVEAIPGRESELTELTRDYATIRTMYTSLLGKNEEAKISANLERRQIGEQFKVVDPARLPQQPFSPDRLRIGTIGAVAGLALGLAFAAFLEYRDTTLKTDDDVLAALALPVLALVPVMRSADERRQQRRRRLIVSLTSVATVLATLVIMFVVWRLKIRAGI